MSGLFSKKYVEQQEFQEGQVPDDVSDQPAHVQQSHTENLLDVKKPDRDEDEFIFQTVPDEQLQEKFTQKDRQSNRNQQYYQVNQHTQKKDWQRNQRQKNMQKTHKNNQKKQFQNLEPKRKTQPQQIRPPMSSQITPNVGYYPGIPPVSGPYGPGPVPGGYYPGYGVIPQPGGPVRGPYAMYPPNLLHQPPHGLYVTPPQVPQNPYHIPNLNLYQIPSAMNQMPYGSVPIIKPMPELYRSDRPLMMQGRQMNDPNINFTYDQSQVLRKNYPQNNYQPLKQQPTSWTHQNRQRQQPTQQQRSLKYSERKSEERYDQRQRSRDRKQFHDHDSTKNQKRQKYHQRNNSTYQNKSNSYQTKSNNQDTRNINYDTRTTNYDNNVKQKSREGGYSNPISFQNQKKIYKEQKKSQIQEQKHKLKIQISSNLKAMFGNNSEERQQFLFVLRDIIKFKLLKRQQEELAKFSQSQSPHFGRPTPIYSLTRQLIISNYDKALSKLQKVILNQSQADKLSNVQSNLISRKQALFEILSSFQLQELLSKIKQMKLKKKLIGEIKMSEIKKLLEELVKDPRKRIK